MSSVGWSTRSSSRSINSSMNTSAERFRTAGVRTWNASLDSRVEAPIGPRSLDVTVTQAINRRGRIDEFDLKALDLTQVGSGEVKPTKFVEAGFIHDAQYYRDYIA